MMARIVACALRRWLCLHAAVRLGCISRCGATARRLLECGFTAESAGSAGSRQRAGGARDAKFGVAHPNKYGRLRLPAAARAPFPLAGGTQLRTHRPAHAHAALEGWAEFFSTVLQSSQVQCHVPSDLREQSFLFSAMHV